MPLPPGPWTPLLIGEHWPDHASLAVLSSAAESRGVLAQAFDAYSDTMRSARFGPLAGQSGVTAEEVHAAFLRGEDHARELAQKSVCRRNAYTSALHTVEALREKLRDIASRGNAAIERVRSSGVKHNEQVDGINTVIRSAREEAARASAAHFDNIFGELQKVLSTSAIDSSSRVFAQCHGFPTAIGPSSSTDLPDRVDRMLTLAARGTGCRAVS